VLFFRVRFLGITEFSVLFGSSFISGNVLREVTLRWRLAALGVSDAPVTNSSYKTTRTLRQLLLESSEFTEEIDLALLLVCLGSDTTTSSAAFCTAC
jgi:hypothetical protein